MSQGALIHVNFERSTTGLEDAQECAFRTLLAEPRRSLDAAQQSPHAGLAGAESTKRALGRVKRPNPERRWKRNRMSTLADATKAAREVPRLADDVKRTEEMLKGISWELRGHDRHITRMEARWSTAVQLTVLRRPDTD